jgi:tetratricopeptide (TPR) repeat protein
MPTQKYLENAWVLIVDRCLASRVAMKEILVEMGASRQRLVLVKTLDEAYSAIEMRSPDLIIGDYRVEDGLALSLLRKNKNAIFFLVSADSSQAAIAKAAEEEVDNFIFKPYSERDFKRILSETIARRIQPQMHDEWLESGKQFLVQGAVEAAVLNFEKARQVRPSFATACSYLGQVKKMKDLLSQSKREYQAGLEQNDVHFRCLSGLYEVFLQQKSIDEAYATLKEMVLSFPEHPERLSAAVALAIRTKNFMDVDVFFEVFQQIYQKTPALVNHMSSALSVSGRYYLSRKKTKAALNSFENALLVSSAQPKFLTYIAYHLAMAGFPREASQLQRRFTRDQAPGSNP